MSTPFSSVALSPDCELCASSTITANWLVLRGNFYADTILLPQLLQRFSDEGKRLQRGDDDRRPARQRLNQLPRVLINLLHHALLMVELVDSVRELLIQYATVRHYDNRIENLLVGLVMQRRQPVRQPRDRVGFPRTGGGLATKGAGG